MTDPELCPDCDGSGEGMNEGSTCSFCGGSGVEREVDDNYGEYEGD
jgi:DnaJ-class molecular chaperone